MTNQHNLDRFCDYIGEYLPIAVMLIAAVFIGFCAGCSL